MNLTHFQPQLDEHISDMLSEANPAECLLEPLSKSKWWTSREYKDIPLHYNKKEMSIKSWVEVAEIFGDATFVPLLKQQIMNTIERQWKIRMQEVMEDMKFEHEIQLERMAVA